MSNKNRFESSFSILEAIETLSTIVDQDTEGERHIEHKNTVEIEPKKREIEWLEQGDPQDAVGKVKEIFHVILNYLRDYYRKKANRFSEQKTVEGIKAIMLLVGEAAKALDKHKNGVSRKWEGSITHWKEYRQLQDFYKNKIDKNIDEKILSRWLLGLTGFTLLKQNPEKMIERKVISTKHLFVDLDTVRKDSEYELMLMTKEDGTRFFNPRLLRNIKLVCDFGGSLQDIETADPLSQVKFWQDRVCHTACKNILKSLGGGLDRYFREAAYLKDMDLVSDMNKAFMALLMGAQEQNLMHNQPAKSCLEYFHDFQIYFRYALSCRDYHKLLAYPPKKTNRVSLTLLDTIHGICHALFLDLRGINELFVVFDQLIETAHEMDPLSEGDKLSVWSRLGADFSALAKFLKSHPHGPLLKVLEHLERDYYRGFDSLIQNNLPHSWYELQDKDSKIQLLRLPSPTHQLNVSKALVTDEFKGFLYACHTERHEHKLLLINLQDRTSWREHSRSVAIEQLQQASAFSENIACVTLAIDTEFFHQLPPYDDQGDSLQFMDHLREHLKDQAYGYYLPEKLSDALSEKCLEKILEGIHRLFFNSELTLSREQRLDFITLFYAFLELKLIDIVQPDLFSLTCKDAVDIGQSSAAFLYLLNKFVNQEVISEKEIDFVNLMLFGPSLLLRERVMLPDVYNRFLSAVKVVEECRAQLGFSEFQAKVLEYFAPQFNSSILTAHCEISKQAA